MENNTEYTLNNGVKIPIVGFGTIIPDGDSTVNAVKSAIKSGYRLIDGAEAYNNEESVGRGIHEAMVENGLKREDIFVTSKVWNNHHGYKKTKLAIEESLTEMKLDYLDLYLIHWPANEMWHDDWREINASTWTALEEMYLSGLVKSIGVSNFSARQLSTLMSDVEIKPMVNQLEYHPGFAQKEAAEFSQKNDVLVEAWQAFGGPESGVLTDPTIKAIAQKYHKNTSQIVLRWLMQMKIIPLAKSTNPEHMRDNLNVFDFELQPEDIKQISAISYGTDTRFDPETYHS